MGAYVESIKKLAAERNALHATLHRTFGFRDQSPIKHREWVIAAERFNNHKSALDPLVEKCFRRSQYSTVPELREFMFDYIKVDPQFFRSGYLMERILGGVKKLDLSDEEKSTLRNLLLNRVRRKALRNFRNICRLNPMIQDENLLAEVEELVRSPDPAVRHRAGFALAYFRAEPRSEQG